MSDGIDEAIRDGRIPPDVDMKLLRNNQNIPGIASIASVTFLATLVVVCRLYSRKFIIKGYGFGFDDGVVLASLVVFIPFTALCIRLIVMGAGQNPMWMYFMMDDETYTQIQALDTIAHLIYSTALVLCRISGIAFYWRLCYMDKKFLMAIKGIAAIILAGYVAQICLLIFHCLPVSMVWVFYTKEDVIGLSASRVVLVINYGWESDQKIEFQFSFLKLLCLEVAEVSATIIAVSVPGVKPLVDKYILRKDKETESGSWKSNGLSMSSSDDVTKPRQAHVDIMEWQRENATRLPAGKGL
ncbi:integral membrane protein pth11 [Metarhizium brunneum]